VTSGAYGNAFAGIDGGLSDDKEIDYNYITMRGKSRDDICQRLSLSLGDMVVSSNDISKLLHDLARCQMENVDSYQLEEEVAEVDEHGKPEIYRKRLVRGKESKTLNRPLVEWGICPTTGACTLSILIHFIKQKLPARLNDALIEDLNKKQRTVSTPEQLENEALEKQREKAAEVAQSMEVEEPEDVLEKKVRAIGRVSVENDTLFYKSFRDVLENEHLENPGMDVEEMETLRESYKNPLTGEVPWDFYITADAPKQQSITHFHPELKEPLEKIDDGDAPIRFVDELTLLELKRNPLGKKIIVRNYNTVSPSTRATSSIYKPREKQLTKRRLDDGSEVVELGVGEVLKKARVEEYSKVDAWVLNSDIDAIFCREHLQNLGFASLESKKDYELINYPPCTYMATMEDKVQKEGTEGALLEYPYVNNLVRIANRKRDAEGLINPESVEYPDFGTFMDANRTTEVGKKPVLIGKPILNRCLETEKERRRALHKEMM